MLNKKGFTLIELMIVVAIIAILAAIAIPNFLNYRYKARTAEAKSNIGSINTLEEAYAAETDVYLTAVANPDVTNIWNGSGASWTDGGYLEGVGFRPKGTVYYSYSVGTTIPTANAMTAGTNAATTTANGSPTVDIYIMASGNLDKDASATFGNAVAGQFYASDENRTITNNNPVEF